MALIVSGISVPFEESSEFAIDKAKKLAKGAVVKNATIVKRSVDARRKDKISFVYSVALEVEGDEEKIAEKLGNPKISAKKETVLERSHGKQRLQAKPIIVGFGPAGMFAGLLLAREGYNPIILERGKDIDSRIKDVGTFWAKGKLNEESNVQFGEGGAGTFSDGKLVTRIGDSRCSFVLREFVKYGAPEEILWNAKPHIGTDKLRKVVKNIREEIIRLGGQVNFEEKLESVAFSSGGKVDTVITNKNRYKTEVLILALGHSARDTFRMLKKNEVQLESKAFSVGVRIEHLQESIDKMLYGEKAGSPLLPSGEYQLSYKEGNRAAYTFCMCPGGVVVPAASSEGMLTTNGMSSYARNGKNANSALVVSVDKNDFGAGALAGVEFQERLEKAAFAVGGSSYCAPIQSVKHFLIGEKGRGNGSVEPSYAVGVADSSMTEILPKFVTDMMSKGLIAFDKKLKGFAANGALLTGVETRTSSPVRIPRGEGMESVSNSGLYPCGEGAGYAGGIMSAAVDGIRSAQAIIEKFSEV